MNTVFVVSLVALIVCVIFVKLTTSDMQSG